jgi:cell division protein FtsW
MFSKIFNKTAQLPDKNLLFAILALIIFGWILSSSASIGHFGNYSKAINQAVYITFGMFLGFFVLKVPLSFYKDNRYWLFLITIVLLAVVFSPIGKTINGSTRWIDLVAFRLQPSEILKIVIILFTAGFLVEQEKDLKHPWLGFFKVLVNTITQSHTSPIASSNANECLFGLPHLIRMIEPQVLSPKGSKALNSIWV